MPHTWIFGIPDLSTAVSQNSLVEITCRLNGYKRVFLTVKNPEWQVQCIIYQFFQKDNICKYTGN